jgi:hypothetical protein
MKRLTLLLLTGYWALGTRCCPAQEVSTTAHDYDREEVHSPWSPGFHPYLEPQFFSGGGGYGPGFTSAAGVDAIWRRFEFDAAGNYGFIRKTNDDDQVPSEHGYTRGVSGTSLYHAGSWLAGGGARWGETDVTPYRKYSWAPGATAGRAFFYHLVDFRVLGGWSHSLREYTDYPTTVQFTPGPGQPQFSTYCICGNGVNAFSLDVFVSVMQRGHVLLHYSFTVLRFHETVTDPYNLRMTAEQDADHGTAGGFTFGTQFRL